jgi:hypothetical protein
MSRQRPRMSIALGYLAALCFIGLMCHALLNAAYAGVGTVWRTNLSARDLLAAVVWSEVSTFTAAQWAAFQTMLIPGVIDASKQTIRDQFAGIFATKVATLANMSAVAKVTAPTRAEELWGAGIVITTDDVAAARTQGGS